MRSRFTLPPFISATRGIWSLFQFPTASVSNKPHNPAAGNQAAHKPDKAFFSVAHHVARGVALGDAEDDRGIQGEEQRRGEVGEFEAHQDFFPMAIWCASTALMMFKRPATTRNLVP